jgi:hypothetical protein
MILYIATPPEKQTECSLGVSFESQDKASNSIASIVARLPKPFVFDEEFCDKAFEACEFTVQADDFFLQPL